MASETTVKCVGDAFDLVSGYAFKSAEFLDFGIRVIKIKNVKAGTFSEHEFSFVDKKFLISRSEKLARPGDLLISMSGNRHDGSPETWVGKVAYFSKDEPHFINQRVGALRLKPGMRVCPRFAGYVLSAWDYQQHFIAVATSSGGQANLSPSQILSVPFSLPSYEDQIAIAHFIGAIDDRIDNLRQANATLQAIAAALFKSRFVDFDGVPPEDVQESELGLIPKGWRVASLDVIADYLNGLALQKFPPEGDTEFLPVIKIAQLRAGHINGADKASTKLRPEYIVQDGDVLFSWSGSLEVEVWTGGRGALNQHLFKITSREVPKWFYYFATRQHLSDFRAIAAGKATTMGHIQRGHLTAAKVAVPPPDEMVKHDAVIAPLFEQKINNALQARTLANLRDALLPRLISGQLRVNQ